MKLPCVHKLVLDGDMLSENDHPTEKHIKMAISYWFRVCCSVPAPESEDPAGHVSPVRDSSPGRPWWCGQGEGGGGGGGKWGAVGAGPSPWGGVVCQGEDGGLEQGRSCQVAQGDFTMLNLSWLVHDLINLPWLVHDMLNLSWLVHDILNLPWLFHDSMLC